MNQDQIVSAVRESARIDTPEHAEMAVRATLRVLGQRLAGEASDLAAQLPPQLAAELLGARGHNGSTVKSSTAAWLPKRAEGAADRRHVGMPGR
jgi:uncharacterized protein (DUF2267 family)